MSLEKTVGACRRLYAEQKYAECVRRLEDVLSDAAAEKGSMYLSELHLLLAKCYRGLGDLKSAVQSCNSSLEHRPHWKDPYLVRSSCFQAWHSRLTEEAGDSDENVSRDRAEADIIVDAKAKLDNQKKVVNRIDQAFQIAEDGSKIFVEKGTYRVTSGSSNKAFLFGKNVSLIGASAKDCVLVYGAQDPDDLTSAKLETLLICVQNGPNPTLIKRLSFRCVSTVKTRFLGVAGGSVQLEDCVFDGRSEETPDVDAIYASARICGNLAANFPPPSVVARFCVFDSCRSFGAFTVARGAGAVRNCYFVGRSGVAALDSAKVKAEHCEFACDGGGAETHGAQTVSGSNSDLTVRGCYIHGAPSHPGGAAVAITVKSVAQVTHNYVYGGSNGISCTDSDLTAQNNLVINCSSSQNRKSSRLGLQTGIFIKNRSKIQLVSNAIQRCDVGIYLGQDACPLVRDNHLESSIFAGVFAECGAKPNVIGNTFNGGAKAASLVPTAAPAKGFGLLWLMEAAGLIGKNHFVHFEVSPIMVFSHCHPLIKDNTFENISIDDERQEMVEKTMLDQFNAELFKKDHHFYIVDSQATEKTLQDVILKGPETST